MLFPYFLFVVVVATAKVQIFKQITTRDYLRQLPDSCCCYRKGTNFQANHNASCWMASAISLLLLPQRYKFSSKSQQSPMSAVGRGCCCCYRKGTNFQANHNYSQWEFLSLGLLLLPQRYKFSSKSQQKTLHACVFLVVVATAKVQIFKQITTVARVSEPRPELLLLPQRYKFSSKSQLIGQMIELTLQLLLLPQRYKFSSKSQLMSCCFGSQSGCCCYRKGTNFQANHNRFLYNPYNIVLLLLPQRYKFSSKSQRSMMKMYLTSCCCCYRKGTNFQANHNPTRGSPSRWKVVVATAKVQIFKQITTQSWMPR